MSLPKSIIIMCIFYICTVYVCLSVSVCLSTVSTRPVKVYGKIFMNIQHNTDMWMWLNSKQLISLFEYTTCLFTSHSGCTYWLFNLTAFLSIRYVFRTVWCNLQLPKQYPIAVHHLHLQFHVYQLAWTPCTQSVAHSVFTCTCKVVKVVNGCLYKTDKTRTAQTLMLNQTHRCMFLLLVW